MLNLKIKKANDIIIAGATEYGVNINATYSFIGSEELGQNLEDFSKFLDVFRSTFQPTELGGICVDLYFIDGVVVVVIADNGCNYLFCNDFYYLFNLLAGKL